MKPPRVGVLRAVEELLPGPGLESVTEVSVATDLRTVKLLGLRFQSVDGDREDLSEACLEVTVTFSGFDSTGLFVSVAEATGWLEGCDRVPDISALVVEEFFK